MPPTDNNAAAPVGATTAAPRDLTFGEKAVGLTFNPSNDASVQACKTAFAGMIDALDMQRTAAKERNDFETVRLFSVAITECQSAQMWAVKAITWKY